MIFCKLILNENELKKDSQCESFVVSTSTQWFIDILFITRDSRMSNKLCGRKTTKQNDFTLWNHSWLLSFCLTSGVELGREVEFAIAEMACVSSNVRRTFHVPSGVRVQRSISGRDVSHPRMVSCFCFRILIGCLGILGLLHRRMVVVSHLFRPQRS